MHIEEGIKKKLIIYTIQGKYSYYGVNPIFLILYIVPLISGKITE